MVGIQVAKNNSKLPTGIARSPRTTQMDCSDLQLAHLLRADNRISPDENFSLHVGLSVADLHRSNGI